MHHLILPRRSDRFRRIGLTAFLVTALLLSAGVSFFLFSTAAQGPSSAALESITASELREKVEHLASADYRGRGNGTPELTKAAEYIARGFQSNGLAPGGDEGRFFQSFALYSPRLGTDNTLIVDEPGRQWKLRQGADFMPYEESPDGSVRGPLVFAGYGIEAPELAFDEVENLDGKIVVVLDRFPRADDPASRFGALFVPDFKSIDAKARAAQAAGAIGMIVIQDPTQRRLPSIQDMGWVFRGDLPVRYMEMNLLRNPANPEIPVVIVSDNAGRRLVPQLRDVQSRIDSGRIPVRVDLEREATLTVDIERASFRGMNVVGVIEGSDPKLRSEALVIGAHYDHDGEDAGQIWYGADDNASGTSALLELAEAFATLETRPARTILLCAWAGEEKGRLGSLHYTANPPEPLAQTIVMIQLDMIGRNEEHGANAAEGYERERASDNENSVNVLGSVFSPDLKNAILRQNETIDLDVRFRYDLKAEDLIRRSDQWSFLERGIPAVFFTTGMHPDYHTPRDTARKINYPKLEKIVRLVFLTTLELANAPARPAYVKPQLQK